MKNQHHFTGITGALLHEYEVSIANLKENLQGINDADLPVILDKKTANKDCVSVQAILTHIIYCGYNYITMMDIHRGNENSPWPERQKLDSITAYNEALDKLLNDTCLFFKDVPNSEMQQYAPENKLITFWGQYYDYEQLMEHAVLHIYRHRRQIQIFKTLLNGSHGLQ
ncbi:MAG TPA: DinB family protein [Chitinophagales bacterium]|nr:DinB family protein [Chitinophagales bacterium]